MGTLLLLAATVRSFAHIPLGISDRNSIGITVHFISNLEAAHCYVGLQTNPQLEETASNFETTNKRIFQDCWTNIQAW